MFHVLEKNRLTRGPFGSDSSYGNNGAFTIDRGRTQLWCIVSDGEGWEHVSVHAVSEGKERIPTWSEMCFIKNFFWDESDCVIQYHPAKNEYVNLHKFCLHLWRPINQTIPIPPKILIGF